MNYFFIGIGLLCIALGITGIFLPLLPTTPFLLLAAFLFARSSTRLYYWLLKHRYLGPYIRDYLEHRTIPRKVKFISISTMWMSILLAITFSDLAALIVILLIATAIGVTFYIASFKSSR